MKKTLKLFSIALAALMLVSALPLTAFATEGAADDVAEKNLFTTNYDTVVNDENLILSIDNLADATNAVANDYKVTGTNFGGTVPVGDDVCDPSASAGWKYAAYETNIPLSEKSQYTITFRAKSNVANSSWMLAFADVDSADGAGRDACTQGVNLTDKYSNVAFRMSPGTSYDGKFVYHGLANLGEYHDYTISINGTDIIFMIDGGYVTTFSVATPTSDHISYTGEEPFVSDTLALGALMRTTTTATETKTTEDGTTVYPLMSFQNIRVYNGAVTRTMNEVEDGTLLFSMDSATSENIHTFESQFSDVKARATGRLMSPNYYNAETNKIIFSGGSAPGRNLSSVWTNVPLTAQSKYTIEFKIKQLTVNCMQNAGICWAVRHDGNDYGMVLTQASQHYNINAGGYAGAVMLPGNSSPTETLNAPVDAEGFTTVRVDINGANATTYIDGKVIKSYNFTYAPGTDNLIMTTSFKISNVGYTEDMTGTVDVGEVKDVKVYAGNVGSKVDVTFEKADGTAISATKVAPLATPAFPEYTPAEGNTVVWKVKGTDTVATPNEYVVNGDVTLVAYEYHTAEVKYFGVQQSLATEDGKCQLRVLATLKGLDADNAGFDIEAKYMDGETLVERTDLGSYVTVVYDKINATENNTVRTVDAEENGGNYIMGLVINGVPVDAGQIDFYIKAFVTIDGEKVYSDTDYRTVSLVDGQLTKDATLLGAAQ